MKYTFAELEKQESPRAIVFLESLEYYVLIGAAISPRVVLGVINGTGLSLADLNKTKRLLEQGYEIQHDRVESAAAKEYQQISLEVEKRIINYLL